MIIRIPGRSRLEASLARFDRWWNGLSHRERVMVGTLGGLLVLLVAVYGVVKPIQAARADARADIRQFETLNARIRAAGTLPAAQAPLATGTPDAVIAAAASRAGLTAQTAPLAAGGYRATVADGTYDGVIRWIDEVARTTTLGVRQVSIVRGATAGRVSATVEFGA
jgi:general secretion pathway protein M